MLPSMLFFILTFPNVMNSEELRFVYSAEQGYDTSCGLSTLACLLDTYWSVPADELSLANEFLSSKMAHGDFTTSFADMETILKAKGFAFAAYTMNFDQLRTALSKFAPVLVHYDRPEGHFALALAIVDDRVVTADPAEGTVARERRDFESMWSGKVLLATMLKDRVRSDLTDEAVASVFGREALLDRAAIRTAIGLW